MIRPFRGGTALDASSVPQILEPVDKVPHQGSNEKAATANGLTQEAPVEGESRAKKKVHPQGRGKGVGVLPRGRGSSSAGWTGAGFDVDGRP